jgi:uroporphyrin-III C-methyltransferase / precorrin-2 dehydrogenase / sirohydrochlorin ferrochelatase
MRYLPLFADLADKKCLLIGGGETAARKLRLLLGAGARPVVLAATIVQEIQTAVDDAAVTLSARGFISSDLDGAALVVVADAPRDEAETIAGAARRAGVMVNVVDQPDLCTVVFPGIIDRDPVLIAVGSAGASPVLVRRIRELIERLLPPRLGGLARFAGRFRSAVAREIDAGPARRAFWERIIDGPIGALVLRGGEPAANEAMLRLINSPDAAARVKSGSVALVGAGPGASDLLTLRALRLIQDADVVVHDALVSADILDLIRRDADRIDVGKRRGHHQFTQTTINQLLVSQANEGRRVVRLKGGDPFLFGRGGEEMEYLRARGIDVDIVPGITAALGAAAATGIPLTHRDHASGVTFITGHGAGEEAAGNLNIPDASRLGDADHTVVFYMGLSRARAIAAQAIASGRAPSTPVAVIDRATQDDQRVLRGTLKSLGDLVERADLAGPALLIIGEVTALGVKMGASGNTTGHTTVMETAPIRHAAAG